MDAQVIEQNSEILTTEKIQGLIYVVRGKQVMLDNDLALLYQVDTGNLNKAMKRNYKRFPENFCFQLTKEEYSNLKFQNGISSYVEHGGRRTLPYVYMEQGIAMLSAVLRSDIAIQVSIKIMKTFVELRRYLAHGALLLEKVNELEIKQLESDYKRKEVEQKTEKRLDEVFDYIVLIDGYVDVITLNLLSKKKKCVDVCIYTLPNARLTIQDIVIFNAQYPNLEVCERLHFMTAF